MNALETLANLNRELKLITKELRRLVDSSDRQGTLQVTRSAAGRIGDHLAALIEYDRANPSPAPGSWAIDRRGDSMPALLTPEEIFAAQQMAPDTKLQNVADLPDGADELAADHAAGKKRQAVHRKSKATTKVAHTSHETDAPKSGTYPELILAALEAGPLTPMALFGAIKKKKPDAIIGTMYTATSFMRNKRELINFLDGSDGERKWRLP